jgi:hypothetical protein
MRSPWIRSRQERSGIVPPGPAINNYFGLRGRTFGSRVSGPMILIRGTKRTTTKVSETANERSGKASILRPPARRAGNVFLCDVHRVYRPRQHLCGVGRHAGGVRLDPDRQGCRAVVILRRLHALHGGERLARDPLRRQACARNLRRVVVCLHAADAMGRVGFDRRADRSANRTRTRRSGCHAGDL